MICLNVFYSFKITAEKFGLFFTNIYTNNYYFNNILSFKVSLTLAHVKVKVAGYV